MNVFFIARLGADAELKDSQNGQFIKMRAAYDEYNKAKGENETVWVNVTTEANDVNKKMLQYWTKGKLLSFTGKERVSLFTAKDGSIGIDRNIRVTNIDFIPGGSKNETPNSQGVPTSQDMSTSQDVQVQLAQIDCSAWKPQSTTSSVSATQDDDLPF